MLFCGYDIVMVGDNMYDQNVVMFIHEFVNKSISEISRITNVHVSEIPVAVESTKRQILAKLKDNFGPFLDNNFQLIEQIIDENIDDNLGNYPNELHEVERLIINQYRHLEIEMQGGLSKTTNINDFHTLLISLNNELAHNLIEIEKSHDREATSASERSFIGIEQKVDAYFVSIGLTNQSLWSDIKQVIDIQERNLLAKIDDKIKALVYTGNDNAQLLFNSVLSKMKTVPTVISTQNNETPDIPMYKM